MSNVTSHKSNVVHVPVLLNEVIKLLDPQSGEVFIDGTFGGGGHSREILKHIGPKGRLLVVDWNEEAIKLCQQQYRPTRSISCAVGNFADLPKIMEQQKFPLTNGLLLDLGLSSDELENSKRGFSFNPPAGGDEPLLMTYNNSQKSVMEILDDVKEEQLAEIIKNYGEERFAKRIAKAIKERTSIKPITTSRELAELIAAVAPRRGRLHPATRTFMALRIYANNELGNLETVLNNLDKIMASGGRVAIIAFHSLEDRIVKQMFKKLAQAGRAEILTKKPIVPTREEQRQNPRSRSAKLRAIKYLT